MILKQVNANAQFAIILSATLWFLYINILNYNFCRIGHPGFIRNGKKRTEILKKHTVYNCVMFIEMETEKRLETFCYSYGIRC